MKQKMNKSFRKMSVDSLIFFCSYIRIHQDNKKFDPDNRNRIAFCVKVLSDINKTPVLVLSKIISGEGRKVLSSIIDRKIEQIEQRKLRKQDITRISNSVQPDELIQYRQFREQEQGEAGFQFDIESDLTLDSDFFSHKKTPEEGEVRNYQLTGLSDEIYVEAKLEIFQHNLNLTLLVVNRTKNTLPSVNVTLLTLGSIKLVSKLPTINLKGYSSETMSASLKVFNTENGGIYGYINYEAVKPVSIPLDGIEIDFMDSLHPGYCTEIEFKKMWADYEWENKITVNTSITDIVEFNQIVMNKLVRRSPVEYIETLQKYLNANRLSPLSGQESGFLVTTFYVKSKFDEDALLSVSIELTKENKINGLIRIRAKTEGMAGCIGNRIKQLQMKI